MAEWSRRLAVKLLASIRSGSGSNPMRGSCQLLTEGCLFTPMNNLFLQLLQLTGYSRISLNNGVKHQFTTPSVLRTYIFYQLLIFSLEIIRYYLIQSYTVF